MTSLAPVLKSLLSSLPARSISLGNLNQSVEKAISDSKSKSSPENWKSQWEFLLKQEVFNLAEKEGQALKEEETTYYDELRDMLDVVLVFTEHDACEQTFPFIVLQDLLETQTISSCSHVFSWIEARATRLTDGMVPQKGKALILLRTLNDLLRRLSKMGTTTIFCGRILTFLSGVFPLGERSGVNLRGEYGPMWEGVTSTKVDEMDEDKAESPDQMAVDEPSEDKKTAAPSKTLEQKDEFYNVFWSLQLPFSRPPLFSAPNTFSGFQDAVNKVLPVIKEATAKERAMMGSRGSSGNTGPLKRKREHEAIDEIGHNEYFFAKFLTSPDLLDLEIADTHFRRQFLFQLLILLSHLLTFTKAAKTSWTSNRNRSLQMDFTLEGPDAQWVNETLNKAMEELRQTTPNGRAFAETVNVVLEREKNWVKWKNELCTPFDKEPWFAELAGVKVGLEEATADVRKKMREEPKDWQWKLGSRPLTEIWELGYRDLSDLETPFQPGDLKDFVKKVKQEDARIEIRKKQLAASAERLRAKARPIKVASTSTASITSNSGTETEPSRVKETVAPVVEVASPRPAPNVSSSPLHPSLPAKPGSSVSRNIAAEAERPATPVAVPAASQAASTASQIAVQPPSPSPPTTDEMILKYEENKQRWSWLALRMVRDQHLQHFGKIGTGDILLLAQEIEKEKMPKTDEFCVPGGQGEDQASAPAPPLDEGDSKMNGTEIKGEVGSNVAVEGEKDVKMEG